jgi:phosphomethylpyrimidine synthase
MEGLDMNKTQLHYARKNVITPQMQKVAQDEKLDIETVRSEIAEGRLIIPANINHKHVRPTGIGIATKCKINANIGNSSMDSDAMCELKKLKVCIEYGADAVMDLSTGSDIDTIRREIISVSSLPVGTVPMYEAAELVEKIEDLTENQLFEIIERHAEQGVDFITVHCGLLRRHLPLVKNRVTGIVSRGGSLIAKWMDKNNKENPLYSEFDRLLQICRKYDMSLSLGDGLRTGAYPL